MKKYIIGGLIGFVLATAASANAEGVTKLIDQVVQGVFPVTVEGNSIGEAVVIDNKTYLPVREFGEAVGYKVTFTEDREVVLTKNEESTNTSEPVASPPPVTVNNQRISDINRELGERNESLKYLQDTLSFTEKTIIEHNKKISTSLDEREKKDLQFDLDKFLTPLVEPTKQKIITVESEIAKLQAELAELQK